MEIATDAGADYKVGIKQKGRKPKLLALCSERRTRDLNPRAGFPTYSLSRGAPSPLG